MPHNLADIVEIAQKGDRRAQRQLYERLKDKMFVLCLRYANNRADAEDILQEGFVKVFRDLKQYRGTGSFEGWARKVILNVALQYIRKQKKLVPTVELNGWEERIESDDMPIFEENTTKGLIKLMQKLSPGFRTVLNLYVLEGYTHPEISEELGISVGTSKSQLMRAKASFKKLLEKNLIK